VQERRLKKIIIKNMKFLKTLLVASIAFTTLHTTAQTADEVITKNIEALGGAAKIATLNSLKMSGSMASNGQDFPVVMSRLHLKGWRMDAEIMGNNNYQLINTEKASAFFPIMGMTEPKDLETDLYKFSATALDLQGAFYNYKEKGTKIDTMVSEKLDGSDAFKIKVTMKNGVKQHFFVDKKTSQIVKQVTVGAGPGGSDVETTYSDYKKGTDGFVFPYTMGTRNGAITFETVEANVKIEESIFKN
jgi:hypothetical protein